MLTDDKAVLNSNNVDKTSFVVCKELKMSSIFAAILLMKNPENFERENLIRLDSEFYISLLGQRPNQSAAATNR